MLVDSVASVADETFEDEHCWMLVAVEWLVDSVTSVAAESFEDGSGDCVVEFAACVLLAVTLAEAAGFEFACCAAAVAVEDD